jgi:hypothetical protein
MGGSKRANRCESKMGVVDDRRHEVNVAKNEERSFAQDDGRNANKVIGVPRWLRGAGVG